MENIEKLQKKLGSIQRGAHYSGLIGRISVVWGAGLLLAGLLCGLTNAASTMGIVTMLGNGFQCLIIGYVFLVGRDALEATEGLIREIGEIV